MSHKTYYGAGGEKCTQLDYIESTGTQYINTGFKPNNNTRVIMDIEPTKSYTDIPLFGARIKYQDTAFSMWLNSTGVQSDFGNIANKITMANPLIRFTIDKNKNIINIENINTIQTAATFSSEYEAYLFGINQNGSLNTTGTCSIKMYSCQIYDNEILIRDFIPCLTEKGRIGLFDKVENKFYENNGTGNFMAGFAYENPINDLSESYTRLEYIESSGTQYINTGFKPSNTTRAVIDFQETIAHTDTPLFGARVGYKNTAFSMWLNATGIQTDFGNVSTTQALSSTTARFRVDKNKNLTSIDAKLITSTSSTFTSAYEAYLFGLNEAGALKTSGTCSIKLYSCQLYDNDTIVRNFVSCKKNSNNEIGLFDTINRVFYGNIGTGSFIAGPEISNLIIIPKDKYIPLQYIRSTGTQYIDTGVIGQADTEFYIDYKYDSVASNSIIIGSSGGSSSRFYPCSTSGYWGYGSYGSISQTLTANKDYELYCKLSAGLQTISLNKTLAYSGNNSSAINSGINMYMFAANWQSTPNYYSTASIKSCKIKQNGELVRDFIPCIQRSTNIIGMYDRINDVFYTNQGSGNFIAGPELQYNLGKTKQVAEENKAIYMGIEKEVSITSTGTINITNSNISTYFTVDNPNKRYYFKANSAGTSFISNNDGEDGTTAKTTWKAKQAINNISFNYAVSSESVYDKLTITVNGEIKVNGISGTKSGSVSYDNLPSGATIVFTYSKDSSDASGSDNATISAVKITTSVSSVQNREVAQKIKKAYFGDNSGIARLVYFLEGIIDVPTEPVDTWKMASGSFNWHSSNTITINTGFRPQYIILYSRLSETSPYGMVMVLKDSSDTFIEDENGNLIYNTWQHTVDVPDWERESVASPLGSNFITDTGFTFKPKSYNMEWADTTDLIYYYAWGQEV